jgi:UPF0176 protein
LKSDPRFADLEHKESMDDAQPFLRMKVKLKKEIVTLGVDGIDPNRQAGTYVEARDWNALISDPDVLVIDTRNDYEVEIGTFKGALAPDTQSFREFPQFVQQFDPAKHRKVAMFCTGGIRCEKASAYMLKQGFGEVYHLKGGILKYLEEVPQEETKWQGDCFVFDNRVTVRHDLSEGDYDQCHACRTPVSVEDRASEHYVAGISCPHCWNTLSEKTRRSAIDRQKQIELAKARNLPHPIGYNYKQTPSEA